MLHDPTGTEETSGAGAASIGGDAVESGGSDSAKQQAADAADGENEKNKGKGGGGNAPDKGSHEEYIENYLKNHGSDIKKGTSENDRITVHFMFGSGG